MTQPSGRTARQLLIDFGLGCAESNSVTKVDAEQIERQLFNATAALLPKPMKVEAYDHEPVKMFEHGYNAAIEKMAKELRVFFGQDGENRKDGGK